MTTAEKMKPWEVMKAHEDGAEIEKRLRCAGSGWFLSDIPCWDWSAHEYRIKPTKDKVLMTPEELAGKWVLLNGWWRFASEVNPSMKTVSFGGTSAYTTKDLHENAHGWADHPTSKLNESFYVELERSEREVK